jgi:hypothetical protein
VATLFALQPHHTPRARALLLGLDPDGAAGPLAVEVEAAPHAPASDVAAPAPTAGPPAGDPAAPPPTDVDAVTERRRLLLLAAALGVLQERPAAGGAASEWLLLRCDADGFDVERSVLGCGLDRLATAPPEGLSEGLSERLRKAVMALDLAHRVHDAARHAELRDAMRARIDALRTAADPAQADALSLAWSDAARAVMRFARKEAHL